VLRYFNECERERESVKEERLMIRFCLWLIGFVFGTDCLLLLEMRGVDFLLRLLARQEFFGG
jgi:hypothetical protein